MVKHYNYSVEKNNSFTFYQTIQMYLSICYSLLHVHDHQIQVVKLVNSPRKSLQYSNSFIVILLSKLTFQVMVQVLEREEQQQVPLLLTFCLRELVKLELYQFKLYNFKFADYQEFLLICFVELQESFMKTICLEGRGPFGMHNEY